MKNIVFVLFLFLSIGKSIAQPVTQSRMDSLDHQRIAYIAQFKDLAIIEMYKSGIPASITLAQGLLETGAGTSLLAQQANNHFGMKCGNRWAGKEFYKADDEYGPNGQLIKSCFRSYDDPAGNFSDHSDFLRDPQKYNRYGSLFLLDPLDYVAWATGLQASGYSPVGHYSARLIEHIERYRLHELDYQAWENRRRIPARQRVCLTNGIRMVRAVEGETLAEIALSCSEDIAAVLEYNENHWKRNEPLIHGTPIYLGSKQSEWRDSDLEFFFVHEGMHIFEISQLFGVRESKIREMNGLTAQQEPAMKSKVRVSGKRMVGEKMATTTSKIKTRVPAQPKNRKPPITPVKNDYPVNSSNMYRLNQILDSQYTARMSTVSHIGMVSSPAPAPSAAPAPMQDNSGKRLLASQKKADPIPVASSTGTFHEVAKGDTLAAVARKYGVTITDLRKLNNLAQDTIKIGQKLRVK